MPSSTRRRRAARAGCARSGWGRATWWPRRFRRGSRSASCCTRCRRLGAALAPARPAARRRRRSPGLVVSRAAHGAEADVELRERVDPERCTRVIRSSGTTGMPKPIELTYANHVASALASADALGVEPDDRWLTPAAAPPRGRPGRADPLGGQPHDRRGPRALRRRARAGPRSRRGEVTLVSLVPTMLARLRDAGLREAPGLRAVAARRRRRAARAARVGRARRASRSRPCTG